MESYISSVNNFFSVVSNIILRLVCSTSLSVLSVRFLYMIYLGSSVMVSGVHLLYGTKITPFFSDIYNLFIYFFILVDSSIRIGLLEFRFCSLN